MKCKKCQGKNIGRDRGFYYCFDCEIMFYREKTWLQKIIDWTRKKNWIRKTGGLTSHRTEV